MTRFDMVNIGVPARMATRQELTELIDWTSWTSLPDPVFEFEPTFSQSDSNALPRGGRPKKQRRLRFRAWAPQPRPVVPRPSVSPRRRKRVYQPDCCICRV